ncbi:Rv3235 family protein [Quadrisphaera sp. INWT6]|uniref:Rv3235 family protein n=1 Tax=Quadrisphaera sp. INWT6 TaxID=2596917 RepID=UPI0018921A8F|nr:Rv3235 family protein [Quadrisphaera sp. INWT6]MBF5081410.1 hypothetical protein [Quadrisphaera sp. INWT6]
MSALTDAGAGELAPPGPTPPPAARSALRVVPAPRSEPAALGAPRRRRPPVIAQQGVLPLVLDGTLPRGVDPAVAPRPTASAELPAPEPLCSGLVLAAVEVLTGARPAAQLVRWLTADVYAGLQQRASLALRVRGRRRTARAVVRHVRVSSPRDGVVEAAVVVWDGERVRAAALRLEGVDHRWRVTALEIG